MNLDDEVWQEDPNEVCVIRKISQATLKNARVDQLAKNGAQDLLVLCEVIKMLLDLNEYNCLHNIRVRYLRQQIYTQIGQAILISINPYQVLPQLYSQESLAFYRVKMGQTKQQLKISVNDCEFEPHLFKIAQLSLDQLFEIKQKQLRICSMIISGESGSGKTESTKILLKYIAAESKSGLFRTIQQGYTVEQQVFASNPVLEAFGNAKTARNDNSSRFGKFIHLYLNSETKRVSSAKIDNYLLEKSRVVKIGKMERNYHIFYQLIAAKIPELQLKSPNQYEYLKYGDLKFQKNDREEFEETDQCLDKLCFTPDEKKYIYQTLAGLLHLGNVQISYESNQSQLVEGDSLKLACTFLGISKEQLSNLVCKVFSNVGKEVLIKHNSLEAAISSRDTLAKHLYDKLFNWLIERVNEQISTIKSNCQPHSAEHPKFMIGILDIFGFEIFTDENGLHTNSFEQLNINFTNEKLQQHFNEHMFIEEQKEYDQEGIQWQQIKFPDNKKIIDLIENSSTSIYKMLIDQTITLNRGDKEFLGSLRTLPKDHLLLAADLQTAIDLDPRFDKKAHRIAKFDWFCLKHFAGAVAYNVSGFVEKNRDSINQEVHKTLPLSKNPVIREIWKEIPNQLNMKQNNVVARFQNSLKDLLDLLNRSMPRYIRCIKPNNNKEALSFEASDVRRQLICSGLMEAIQIRKAGYEIRKKHQDFIAKYKHLIKGKVNNIKEIIQKLITNEDFGQTIKEYEQTQNFQIGKTKIYMRDTFRDFLDQKLSEFRLKYVIKIQKQYRTYIYVQKVKKNLKSLLNRFHKLQRSMKRFLMKKRLQKRIELRKKLNKLLLTMTKIQNKQLKQKHFLQLKEKINLIKEQELAKQLQEVEFINYSPSPNFTQIIVPSQDEKEQEVQTPQVKHTEIQQIQEPQQSTKEPQQSIIIDQSKELVHEKEISFYQEKITALMEELEKEKQKSKKLEEQNTLLTTKLDEQQKQPQSEDQFRVQITQLENEIFRRDQTIRDLNIKVNDYIKQIKQVNTSVRMSEVQDTKFHTVEQQLAKRNQQHLINQKLIKAMNQGIRLKILEIESIYKHFNIKTQEQKLAIYEKVQITKMMESSDLLMKQIKDQYQEFQQMDSQILQ